MTGAYAYASTSGATVASGRGVVTTGAHRGVDARSTSLPELAGASALAAFPQLVLPSVSDDGMAGCGPQQVANPGRFVTSLASTFRDIPARGGALTMETNP